MTPMVPMPHRLVSLFEGIGCDSPFTGRGLPRQNEPGQARPGEFLKLRGEILAAAILRVQNLLDLVMKLADRYREIAMVLPPISEEIGDHLAAPIALLYLADPLCRILTT